MKDDRRDVDEPCRDYVVRLKLVVGPRESDSDAIYRWLGKDDRYLAWPAWYCTRHLEPEGNRSVWIVRRASGRSELGLVHADLLCIGEELVDGRLGGLYTISDLDQGVALGREDHPVVVGLPSQAPYELWWDYVSAGSRAAVWILSHDFHPARQPMVVYLGYSERELGRLGWHWGHFLQNALGASEQRTGSCWRAIWYILLARVKEFLIRFVHEERIGAGGR